jgi:hypothetical protein
MGVSQRTVIREVLYDLYHNCLVKHKVQEEVFWTAKGVELCWKSKWLSKIDRLDNKASSDKMKDHAPVPPAESPATLHHKQCNVETKHFYLPQAYSYSFHTDKLSAYLMACHIPVLKLDSSTALTATNTNTATCVCYLISV